MTLNELLAKLSEQGVKFWAEDNQLRIRAPKGALTPELRESLTEHKAELLLLLRQRQIGTNTTELPLVSRAQAGNLPLSFEQERLWVTSQLAPESAAHNIVQAIQLKGQLDVAVLEKSLNEILRRHEALRTCFAIVKGKPVQVIGFHRLTLPLVDFQDLNEVEQEVAIRQIADQGAEQPFDINQRPLLHFKLLRLSESEHVLFLVFHHLISDVLSVGLFIRELAQLYEASVRGQPSPLSDLPIQYADFAVWQRKLLQSEVLESQMTYWKKQLDGVPAVLELPVDRPRPLFRSFRGAHQFFKLYPSLWSALKQLSSEQGITPFTVLLAAFKVLLYQCSGQKDIVVGSPTSGRVHPQLESLIGFFAYPLVLRTDLSGNPSFQELLNRVREVTLAAYSHQIVPFGKVVEVTQPKRSKRHNPLFQVLFSFLGKQLSSINIPGLTFIPMVETSRAPTDMDLFLTMYEADEGLHGVLEFNTDLFDPDTIAALSDSYCQILSQCVQSPEARLTEFKLSQELDIKAKSVRVQAQKQKLAIAATFTAEPVADSLVFWLQELDLPCQIDFAPYNQVFQQLLDPASLLAQNQAGINIVLVRFEDWVRFEDSATAPASFYQKIERNVQELVLALKGAAASTAIPYLVCLCPTAPATVANEDHAAFLKRMEGQLVTKLADISGVYLLTKTELATAYPVATFYDPHGDELGHIPFTPLFFTALGTAIARKIYAIWQARYKVIVLDCDRTLWQGVCGEEGADGIVIDPSRQALQEFMVAQHDSGMLLCLCSKNNEEDVFQVFDRHRSMPLQRQHFVSWRINWQPKSTNLKSLAQELQLGLDSFIFIDDNPVECAEVQANCPEVLTLQLPDKSEKISKFLQHIWAFDRLKITAEDRQRTAFYQQNVQREQLRQKSLTLGDFLNSLNLQVHIAEMALSQLARVAQLTQRTNQFNATTIRRSQSQIQTLCQSGEYTCLVVEVKDRFGDYGLVGVIIFAATASALEVDTFLLSCRVLGKGVEHQMLAKLGKIAQERGLAWVEMTYKPTPKNQPILDFLNRVGAEFKKPLEEGYSFKFSVAFCEAIAYNPESTDFQDLPVQQFTPVSRIWTNSALMNRISTQLSDPKQIYRAVESHVEKFQGRSLQERHEQLFVAPRTETETKLVDLWTKVLRLETVSIYDNFFDLGGNSLLAIQLMSQVQKAFQVDLPLNHLLSVSTVAGLAQVIEEIQQKGLSAIESTTTFINLDAEAVLDPTIVPDATSERKPVNEPGAIFLTGATGFLGAFVLQELLQQTQAEIYCLVRSPNAESGQQKIKSNLEKYHIWAEGFSTRIVPISGDLCLPCLGLSEEEFDRLTAQIDVIYHNGAFVNFTYPYSKLKASNVIGTQEVLRLACQTKVKPVHFVSTVAIFDSVDYANIEVARETDPLGNGEGIYGGYAQSKWVAEKLVAIARDRGLPVSIYRPGAITGHSKTGDWNTDDAICRILRGVIQLGKSPNLDAWVEIVPVDYVAKSIVYLSQRSESLGQVFHLVNPQILHSTQVTEWIRAYGYPLEQISYAKWQEKLVHLSRSSGLNPLYPLLPIFFEQVFEGVTLFETLGQRPKFDCQNTLDGLAGTDIVCPSIENLLSIYLSYLSRNGLLQKPQPNFSFTETRNSITLH